MITTKMSTVRASTLIGPFCLIRDARCRRISTSPSPPDPDHDPMIPHVIVLEPGLVIFKIYNGYWFFGRPTIEELRQDLRAVLEMPSGLGHRDARTESRLGTRRSRSLLSLWQNLWAGISRAGVITCYT